MKKVIAYLFVICAASATLVWCFKSGTPSMRTISRNSPVSTKQRSQLQVPSAPKPSPASGTDSPAVIGFLSPFDIALQPHERNLQITDSEKSMLRSAYFSARDKVSIIEAKLATIKTLNDESKIIQIPEYGKLGLDTEAELMRRFEEILGLERGRELFEGTKKNFELDMNGWGKWPQNILVEREGEVDGRSVYSFTRSYTGASWLTGWTGVFDRTISSRYVTGNLGEYERFAAVVR